MSDLTLCYAISSGTKLALAQDGGVVRKRTISGPDGKPLEVTEVSFQNAREHWNEYLLDDGTILKLKPVATEVFRVDGRYDVEGNPVYLLRSRNVVVVNASEQVKKPKEGGAQ